MMSNSLACAIGLDHAPRVPDPVLIISAPWVKARAEQTLDRIGVVATDRHSPARVIADGGHARRTGGYSTTCSARKQHGQAVVA